MRTSFDLKIVASTIEEAKTLAIGEISKFLGIPESEVPDRVSMELKVSYPKAETVSEIEQAVSAGIFQVIAFGTVKQGVVKHFGV
jgi:hypothetical protein